MQSLNEGIKSPGTKTQKHFTGWVSEVPKVPKVFGEEEEIDLGGTRQDRNVQTLKQGQQVAQST
jgi:hypothetical protein